MRLRYGRGKHQRENGHNLHEVIAFCRRQVIARRDRCAPDTAALGRTANTCNRCANTALTSTVRSVDLPDIWSRYQHAVRGRQRHSNSARPHRRADHIVREADVSIKGDELRTRPVFDTSAKRGNGNRRVDFADHLNHPKQMESARLQLATREVERIRVHQKSMFRYSSKSPCEFSSGQWITTHPARDCAEPTQRNEVVLQRCGNRRRVIGAVRGQRICYRQERTHLSEPDDLSTDATPCRNPNREISYKRQLRPPIAASAR